jgi:paraquat-inducible protein B
VIIGQVKTVQFTEDYANVEVTAKVSKRAAGLMVDDAQFWVVRPTISLSGISGLNTLLSGNYIGFQAGTSDVERSEFVGLDKAPFVAGQLGREFTLKAADLGSLAAGSPLYYRRLPVGQVIGFDLTPDGKSVDIQAFVNAPYDKFVSLGTRFWRVSGFDVTFDANGLDVRTESLAALLVGGISFDAPPFMHDTTVAPPDAVFPLYADRNVAMKARRRDDAHVRAALPRVAARARRRRARDLPRRPGRRGRRHRLRLRAGQGEHRPARDGQLPSGAPAHDHRSRAAGADRAGAEGRRQAAQRVPAAHDRRAGPARAASDRKPPDRPALRRVRLFPEGRQGEHRDDRGTTELPVVASDLVDLQAKLASILDKIDKLPLDQIAAASARTSRRWTRR